MKEFTLNGIDIILKLDTKRHVWKLWIDSHYTSDPDLEFTKAKGDAVVEFLEELTRIVRDRND